MLEAVRLGDALGRVLDGLLQIIGVDAVELGSLEDLPVDLLDLDAVDPAVGRRRQDHRLEERSLLRRVLEVDVIRHAALRWPQSPKRRTGSPPLSGVDEVRHAL